MNFSQASPYQCKLNLFSRIATTIQNCLSCTLKFLAYANHKTSKCSWITGNDSNYEICTLKNNSF